MCGIVGMVGVDSVAQDLYDALLVLQHRGQDAAGICTAEHGRLHLCRDRGLARDVFNQENMVELLGSMGIAHVRYPTAGSDSAAEAQPFYVNSPYGIVLGHNGNLVNADTLRGELFERDRRHLNTDSDSEVLLNVFAQELQSATTHLAPDPDDVFEAVRGVHRRCSGGYAAVALIPSLGVIAFRDPFGIRPVVYGRRETERGTEFMVASESVALDTAGFERIRDLWPGEALVITQEGEVFSQQCAEHPVSSPCIFEFVYFARPDSIIDDIFVHKARSRMGKKLADRIKKDWAHRDIDVVIPIPDTSRTSALMLAKRLDLPYTEGFIKNRYIGRTFIMPGQSERKKSVRQKLNPIDVEFKGKNVLLVDDSVVRGTTSKKIVSMARQSGANKVYFASASPAVIYPNVYGIDMPAKEEFVAHNRTLDQIRDWIGSDGLIYQDLTDLREAVQKKDKVKVDRFDCSVFDGDYITGDVSEEYLRHLAARRNDDHKQMRLDLGSNVVDLYNQATGR